MLFEIIDTMVDYYLRVVDRYEDRLEALEEQSFDIDVDEEVLEEAAELRRDLLELRRLAVAQRQLLLPVAKGEYDFVSETLGQQFSHVCDHLSQVIDTVDSLRETIVSIRDNYHAALTRRTNEIMKVLTLYAAIMLPLTLIAGHLRHESAALAAVGSPAQLLGRAGGRWCRLPVFMLVYFRRRKWL